MDLGNRLAAQVKDSHDHRHRQKKGGRLAKPLEHLTSFKSEGSSPNKRWLVLNRPRKFLFCHFQVQVTRRVLPPKNWGPGQGWAPAQVPFQFRLGVLGLDPHFLRVELGAE